jgi:hypothetical protein
VSVAGHDSRQWQDELKRIDTDTTGMRRFTHKFHQEAPRTPVDFHQQGQ